MDRYDAIVVGIGGMGSAALFELARRGLRVLGLERFDLGHSMGSSHGVNRIIRLSYFEDPAYVPILRRAYAQWREAERLSGERLLFVTGSLDIGPAEGRIVRGSLAACRHHDLPHERLDGAEVNRRFPGYRLPEDFAAVLQPDGGFVASERAILAYAGLAIEAGATIRARERVLGIEPGSGRVTVRTEAGRYEATRLIVATGAWIGDLVPGLAPVALPERQVLGWFQPARPTLFRPECFPVSNMETRLGHFYQFPSWGVPGFKIGRYHHLGEHGHADQLSREPNGADEEALRIALRAYFPDADGPTLRLAACLFTNTPDEHFVIDRLPGYPEITVASPCSGHGFKFASAIGSILADLATDRDPGLDLSLFQFGRFGAERTDAAA